MRRLTDPHPVAVTWLGPVRLVVPGRRHDHRPARSSRSAPHATAASIVVAVGTAVLSLLVLDATGRARRPARARRRRPPGARGAADLPGLPRPTHRPGQPAPLRRRARRPRSPRARAPGSIAVLFLDLDDFKTVNDGLGHAAGDELLAAVGSDRIRSSLRETDLAARLGGDEFGILLTDVPDAAYAVAAATGCSRPSTAPIDVAGLTVTVGASIGIALDTADDRSASTTCSARPTSRCTGPRRRASGGTTSSVRPTCSTRRRPPGACPRTTRTAGREREASSFRRPAVRRPRPRAGTGLDSGGDGDPALPAAPGPLPRDRPPAAHLRGPLPGDDPALPRHRRAVRRGPHPGRPRDRHARASRRWPASGRSPRSARPAATRTGATTCSPRRPAGSPSSRSTPSASRTSSPRSRRSTTRSATRPAPSVWRPRAIRRFVRYLDLMRARDGESSEVLDIRVEIEAPASADPEPTRWRPPSPS